MMTLAGLLATLAFGGMAMYSFVIAPLVFAKLPLDQAGRFMRDAFAIYYPVMAALTGLGAMVAPPFWTAALLGLVCIGFLLAHLLLRPEVNRLSDLKASGDAEAIGAFRRLHGLSQALNLAQFLVLLFVVFRIVNH
ncbi:DUF4149 domain-containing protein [Zavarzinia compransoris]|uniref:DUF4149 domain-containing protein n=1 Tax=Zavarzinia marina TaxID=2911065 RepID=UPI001F39761A|nr:DUF4149 domain-containing protein [Zavarzinia marina]MCF4164095.1 DUF4149 domain-containing protein [Zavarzinia marina]